LGPKPSSLPPTRLGACLLNLVSSIGLKTLCFTLAIQPSEANLTDIALEPSPQICFTSVDRIGTNLYRMCLLTCSNQWLIGTQEVAKLFLRAAPDQVSRFVTLTISNITATTTNGFPTRAFGDIQAGRIIIVGSQPLLEPGPAPTNGQSTLILYGRKNTDYSIEKSKSLGFEMPVQWEAQWWGRLDNTNATIVPVPTTSPSDKVFFRAVGPE